MHRTSADALNTATSTRAGSTSLLPQLDGGGVESLDARARNFERTWFRVRRRVRALGVRPIKFHTARPTYASLALASGKSVRWTADEFGHASPMLALETHAHAMRDEDAGLSFADFEPDATVPVGPRERVSGFAIRRRPAKRMPETTAAPS